MLSFFSAIGNGVVDGFKAVVGIPPSHHDDSSKKSTDAGKASSSSPTSYEKPKPTAVDSSSQITSAFSAAGIGAGTAAGSHSSHASGDPAPAAPGTERSDSSAAPTPRAASGTTGTGDDGSQPPAGSSGSTYADTNVGTQQGTADTSTGGGSTATSDASSAASLVNVYDSSKADGSGRASLIGTADAIDAGKAAAPDNAKWAARNVSDALSWYKTEFGRNGLDGKGGGVDVVLNDESTDANGHKIFQGNGGFYTTANGDGTTSEAMRFGEGTSYAANGGGTVRQYEMEVADDLAVHELTHGVIKHSTGAIGGEKDESGSVNEGLADIMAAAETKDWVIGEGLFAPDSARNKMRNIANPTDPKAVHGLWTTMDEYRQHASAGTIEEHYASGILSQAAYRMQQQIGGDAGFTAIAHLTYDTITGGQMGKMTFEETANAMRQTADREWGAGSRNAQIVDTSLRQAGL